MDETSQDAEIESLKVRQQELERRLRLVEKLTDTHLETPWWKRIWFALDGWPLHGLAGKRQWRPWHVKGR